MKLSRPLTFLVVLGFLIVNPLVDSVRAGSAVATDHEGGFGYAFGPQPEKELRRTAIHRCRDKSKYPEDVEIVVSTASRGAGIILRFRVDGKQRIYAYAGADSAREAYNDAVSGARDMGATGNIEVVARWQDD